jgi:hypothetical protein
MHFWHVFRESTFCNRPKRRYHGSSNHEVVNQALRPVTKCAFTKYMPKVDFHDDISDAFANVFVFASKICHLFCLYLL